MPIITVTCPDGSTKPLEICSDIVVHAVDNQGQYLGLVAEADAPHRVPKAPSQAQCTWDFAAQAWRQTPTLAQAQVMALDQIDTAAGAARMRYITDVPGQQATYLEKAAQAASFLAAPSTPVPPYIQAEADALNVSPLVAAQGIAELNQAWVNIKGPAIECERRRGKVAVAAAANTAGVAAALSAALAALGTS